MKIIHPFRTPEKFPMTQRFGVKFRYAGKIATHKGVDYGLPNLTPIIAPFDGIIKRTSPDRTTGYGKAVYLETHDPKQGLILALMAHLDNIQVKEGYKIKKGNMIGDSGRSGFWRGVNGYHIHFGISIDGHFVDPLPLLKQRDTMDGDLFNQDDSSVKAFLGNYTVKVGDTLWNIAQQYYGNGGHYMEIFRVNEDVLQNPNLIHPGQFLRIPVLKNNGI